MAKQLNKAVSGGGNINFQIGLTSDTTGLNQLKTSLTELQKMTSSDLMDINKNMNIQQANSQLKELKSMASSVQLALGAAFNKELGTVNVTKFNAELSKTGYSLQTISTAFNSAGEKGRTAFRNLATEALTAQRQVKQTHNLIQDMANTMANTVKWSIASSAMNNFTGSIQKAYSYVKQLDTSLNNIMIVTDKSSSDMERFAKQANKAAQALGAQTTAYTDAALIYYQQGLNDQEVQARAETTVKAANVTGMSGSDTSEALTAVWNGYRVQAEETELYVDKLAKVAAGTAADLEELSTGMSKVASAANTAGVDVDQLNAILGTVISVTREAPETIGSGFKTIFARMGDLALDGEDEYGVTLGNVSGKLHDLGIELLDEQGNMRDMGSVIEETAEKWDTWTRAQKQAAAVAMAGKMQYSRLMSLFENWDMYSEALDMSKNSVGELQKQQDIYLQSTEAHLAKMRASFEDLYDSLLDNDSINMVTDAIGFLVNRVTDLVDGLGGGTGVLLNLGSIATKIFSKQIAQSLTTTITNIRNLNSNLKETQTEMTMLEAFKGLDIQDDNLKEILALREEFGKYTDLFNEEELNQANSLIKAKNEIINQKQAWEENLAAAKKYYEEAQGHAFDNDEKETKVKNPKELSSQSKEIQKISDGYTQLSKTAENAEDQLNQLMIVLKKTNKTEGESTGAYNKISKSLEELTKKTNLYIDTVGGASKYADRLVELKELQDEIFGEDVNLGENTYDDKEHQIAEYINKAKVLFGEMAAESQKVATTIQNNATGTENSLNKSESAIDSAIEKLKERMNTTSTVEGITTLVGSLGQVATAITSIQSLGSIWDDQDLTDGEKLIKTIETLAFTLPMVINGLGGIKAAATTAFLPLATSLGAVQVAEGAAAGEATIMWSAILGPVGAVLLAIGAVGFAIYKMLEASQAEQKEIDAMNEAAASLAERANETKESVNELKDNLSAYDSAVETLTKCVKGSEKWNEALMEVNQTVLDILEKYPDLAKIEGILKTDKNTGALSLDQDLLNTYINQRLEGAAKSQANALYTRSSASLRQAKKDQQDYEDEINNRVAYNSSNGYATENTPKINVEDLMGLTSDEYKAKIKEFTDSLKESGEYYNYYIDQLSEELNEDYTKVQRFGQAIESTTKQLEQTAQAVAVAMLGTDGSASERQIAATTYADEFEKQREAVKKEINDGLTVYSGKDDKDYEKLIEEFNNATGSSYSDKTATKNVVRGFDASKGIVVRDEEKREDITISKEELIDAIAGARAQETAGSKATGQEAQRLNQKVSKASGLTESMSDTLLDKDFDVNQLSNEEFEQVKSLKDKIASSLTTEEFKKLGYESGEDWANNFEQALSERNEEEAAENVALKFKNAIAAHASDAAEDFDLDEDLFEDYANYLADISDESDELADVLETDADAASVVTKSIMRMNKGIEDLAEGIDEWTDIMKKSDKTSQEYFESLSHIRDGLADILDTESDFISAKFVEDHLDDIKLAAEGNAEAIDRLRDAYADQIVLDIALDNNISEEVKNKLTNTVNQVQADIPQIEVGAVLRDGDFVNQCQSIIDNANMTVEDANKMFSALGFEAEYEVDENKTTVSVPRYKTVETITKNNINFLTGKGTRETESYTVPLDPVEVKGSQETMSMGVVTNDGKNVRKPKIKKLTKKATGSSNNYSPKNAGGSSSPKKSSGGSKSSEPKTKDLNKDEVDRYEKVNVQLEKISANLKKLQSQEDKLLGQKLIDNLNKQLQQLNKQIDKTNEKLKIARGEQTELQEKLRAYGIQFDAEGVMTNYASVFAAQQNALNSLYNQYNRMSADAQDGFEDTLKNAEEKWNKFKDLISDYDNLIGSTIPGLEQDIQDAIDEQLEIKIKEFDMEIELALDIKDAQDKWNEFKKNIIKDLQDDDILGNALDSLERFADYYDEAGRGVLQEETKYLQSLMEQIDQYNTSGWSDWYGDNETKIMEDLKEYYEQAFEDLQNVKNLVDDIHEALNETLEDVADRMAEQMNYYETISDTLEHDMKMVELVYGDEAFGKLELYYAEQEKNYNNQLEFQRAQIDFWKQQMDALDKGSTEWETARDNWLDAVSEWQSMIESAIENLTDKYLNTINKIFQELNNQVTKGAGMDFINTEWELIQKHADEYLDTINSTYGIQQLQNKYLDAMNDTDNLTYQKKLNELMKAEVADLKTRDRLTQYDLDRAELKYQIALKQIALQEAQQNKSTMRLKRDNQGNYSYQYVSDDDEVKKAQEEISDLYNQLYNLDVDRYTGNLDQLYEIWMEYQEKMAEAAAINDPELRLQKEQLLTQQYGDLINGIVDQNEQLKRNLYESTFLELEDLYGKQSEIVQDFLDNQDDAMSLLVNGWASGLQEMADQIYAEGGFEPTYEQALADITEATANYEESLKQLQDSAKVTFETLGEDVDEVETEVQQLINKTDELVSTFGNEVEQIKSVIGQIDELNNHYQEQTNVINTAIDAYNKYIQKMREAEQAANKNTSSNGGSGQSTGGSSGNGSSGGGGGAGNANRMPSVGQWVTYNGGYYYGDSYGGGGRGSRGPGKRVKVTIVKNDGRPYPIHVESSDSAFGWLRKDQLSGYDTGGYTGSWGSTEGRVALLHEKELVLNKEDTKNLLDTVEIMRNLTNSLGSSILKQMASMSRTGVNGMVGGEVLEQEVHIDAQFPNVRDSREIENALNNLVNAAAQRANKR